VVTTGGAALEKVPNRQECPFYFHRAYMISGWELRSSAQQRWS